jgi:hypothetical protein
MVLLAYFLEAVAILLQTERLSAPTAGFPHAQYLFTVIVTDML